MLCSWNPKHHSQYHIILGRAQAKYNFTAGEILLVDKPLGWTSFDVVNKIRYAIRKHFGYKKLKVGHAGTLDPLATGLLVLCTGKFTKRIQELQNDSKSYVGCIRVGATTASYDLETNPENQKEYLHLSRSDMLRAAQQLTGKLSQVPPLFSAKKQDGKVAYIEARNGRELVLKPNSVEVFDFKIVQISLPDIHFSIHCSKGTYIRSLAHDFGQILGCGAHLSELRRTQSGVFLIENAYEIETLLEDIRQEPVLENTNVIG